MFRRILPRLRALFRGSRLEDEMDEELRFHLEKQIEDNIKAGMTPEEARYAALRTFGGVEQIKERCRDTHRFRFIEDFRQDVCYGFRMLLRNPGFSAVSVFSLALGIGANTAVFGLIDTLIFRPFPVRDPNDLAVFTSAFSYPEYLDYRDRNEVFTGVMAYRRLGFRLSTKQHGEPVEGEAVSANYFAVLGLDLPAGRSFLPEEDAPGSQPVAVLSHGLWQRGFGCDPAILGKTVTLNGESLTIIGVAPKSFRGMELYGAATDIWIRLSTVEQVMHFKNDPNWHDVLRRRDARWLGVTGRLKPGTTLEQAQAAMTIRADQLEKAYGKPNQGSEIRLSPLGGARIPPKSIRFSLALLTTVASLVLLIVCANVANLLVARASVRQREIGIRLALGAGRARLVRQLLTESVLLSGLGMASGLVVAFWTMGFLSQFRTPMGLHDLDFNLDLRILAFALTISLLTCIAFGLAPAVQASRADPRSALQHFGSGFRCSMSSSRLRKSLVVCQVAASVILLISAGLLLRTLRNLHNIDPGFKTENVLILPVDLTSLRHGYDERQGMALYRGVLERIRGLPGVRSVAWAGDAPLTRIHIAESFVPAEQAATGKKDWGEIECNVVTPSYFEVLGIPLLRGRGFSNQDQETAPGVVIVNQTMARRYWPGADPVGKRIRVKGRTREIFEVIGVATDAKYRTLSEESKPYAYFSLYQRYYSASTLHVKIAGDPEAMLPLVRREIEAANRDVMVSDARPLAEQIAASLAQQRVAATLLGIPGFLALMLATVGLYGVMAFFVARRTQEIGIRLALGARRKDILSLTFKEGMNLVLIGLGIGLPLALVSSRFLASWIHGVGPTDAATYIGVSLLFIGAGSLAIYVPARRASKVDPMAALRCE
ncbi:MAG: hypothetical protein DMG08_12860 [Acidobacteria bacterium]|nr:MAG: hypothetical protein DMG08_12860 [Acidobacteriota bacterium]